MRTYSNTSLAVNKHIVVDVIVATSANQNGLRGVSQMTRVAVSLRVTYPIDVVKNISDDVTRAVLVVKIHA